METAVMVVGCVACRADGRTQRSRQLTHALHTHVASFVVLSLATLLTVLHLLEGLHGWLNEKNVKGHLVVITGGGSGIGRLLALRFARLGARVAVLDLNKNAADGVAKEITVDINGEAKSYYCDVSNREAVYALAVIIKKEFGAAVDILINNAGIISGKPFLENSDEMVLKTFQVNTIAHFWTTKAFLADMLERDYGHIVTIASAAGLVGVSGMADYCASKHAVVGFDESLRQELFQMKKYGVRTTCVCPYYVNTGMFQGVRAKLPFVGMDMLDQDYVVNEITNAILRNKSLLYLPAINVLPTIGRALLPTRLFDIIIDATGISSGMQHFTGRTAASTTTKKTE